MVNLLGRTDSVETHDPESLRRAVSTIRNLLAPAIRLAGDPDQPHSIGAMQAAGVAKLEISFIQSLERAMKELSRWGGACEKAWTRQLIEMGAVSQHKPGSSKPAAKARAVARPAAKARHAHAKHGPAKAAKQKKR